MCMVNPSRIAMCIGCNVYHILYSIEVVRIMSLYTSANNMYISDINFYHTYNIWCLNLMTIRNTFNWERVRVPQ